MFYDKITKKGSHTQIKIVPLIQLFLSLAQEMKYIAH